MIKENQRALNFFNILLDALILLIAMPVAFYARFYILHNGIITVPLSNYMAFLLFLIPAFLVTFATLGLYESLRQRPLTRGFWGSVIDFILAQTFLFLYKEVHFFRGVSFSSFAWPTAACVPSGCACG